MLDPEKIRKDFPILTRKVNGKKLVYLDNAATTQKPIQVIEAISDYYTHSNSNVRHDIHALGLEVSRQYDEAHEKTADFIHARSPNEIIFTKNCTESINLVAYTYARANLQEGDEILTTVLEHHSNLVPWQILARQKKAKLVVADIQEDGTLDRADFTRKLSRKTKLVALTHCSNVLGTITPLKELTREAHDAGAVVLGDGAQSAPSMEVDVRKLGVDFYAFSAHKMLGPTGIGVLYGRHALLEEMPPFLTGGHMIDEVWADRAEYSVPYWKFEAGTPNIAGAVGFSAALDYLQKVGMSNIERHERQLARQALEQLEGQAGIRLYGPAAEQRTGIISLNLENIHPHDVATVLDQEGIAVRAGDHCGQPLMRRLGMPGSVRMSFYIYNTEQDVDAAVQALQKVRKVFS